LAWLVQIQAAIANLQGLDYLQSSAEQSMQQSIETNMMTLDQSVSQTSQIQVDNTDGERPLVASQLEQMISIDVGQGVPITTALTMEAILDGESYLMRYLSLPPDMATLYPEGWFNAASRPELSGLNFEAIQAMTGWEALSIYPLTEEVVLRIKVLPEEALDGQTMQVFNVIIAPSALLETTGLGAMFDTEQMGVSEDLIAQLFESATYSIQVWIGEDGLLHQMESIIIIEDVTTVMEGQAMTLNQETYVVSRYFGFDKPVQIEIPTLE
jgi:hypothetical protein